MSSSIQPAAIPQVVSRFHRARDTFGEASDVFRQVSDRMLERLELLATEPARILDLGCRDGYQMQALRNKYPQSHVLGVDLVGPKRQFSGKWLRQSQSHVVIADQHALPIKSGSIDLVVSNLLLPWSHDPALVFNEVSRVLTDNGAFFFTTAGPDTLVEYADIWNKIDSSAHVFGLADMHQTGDALLASGFSAPVLDRENITVDYPSIGALQLELQLLGASNIAIGRRNGLMASNLPRILSDIAGSGRFSATLELVQGHGWKGSLPRSQSGNTNEFSVSLDSLKRSLRGDSQ